MTRCGVLVGMIAGVLVCTPLPADARDRAASSSGPPHSVVLIAGFVGTLPAYGCGVIVAEQRSSITILTAAHNLQILRPQYITVAGERLDVRESHVVPGHDLALVTTGRPARSYEVARLAPEPELGTRVHLWGPIRAEPFTLHQAVVREIDPRLTDPPEGSFAIDCAACGHGDSGTGVFNARDELVGIVTAGYFAAEQRVFVLGERYRAYAGARHAAFIGR